MLSFPFHQFSNANSTLWSKSNNLLSIVKDGIGGDLRFVLVANVNNNFYAILKNWRWFIKARCAYRIGLAGSFRFSPVQFCLVVVGSRETAGFPQSQNKLYNIGYSFFYSLSHLSLARFFVFHLANVHGMHEITVWLWNDDSKPHHSWFWFAFALPPQRNDILERTTAESPRDSNFQEVWFGLTPFRRFHLAQHSFRHILILFWLIFFSSKLNSADCFHSLGIRPIRTIFALWINSQISHFMPLSVRFSLHLPSIASFHRAPAHSANRETIWKPK